MKLITITTLWLIMGSLFIVLTAGFLSWHFVQIILQAALEAEA